MTAALAATEAWWEPGTRHAYHTNTYGHLVGEIVRRVDRRDAGRRGCARVAEPLDADVWFGVPERRAAPVRRRDLGPAGRRAHGRLRCALEGDELMDDAQLLQPARATRRSAS